ncbi:secretion protein [Pseudomonas syringae]|uniref:type II secretion system F family protein n=1 Tax=Pseudomonas syringae TaxID=317 RepID=UPI001F169883|nr:type II secretion system F family protein [Pseudomonas syringae]MCF5382115.1 secretion protein [Pseudomonas syringae]MCF5422944.1 secretion protein [Pseudomonas syringae]MCF5455017.1 secretion protein [Pseudomonas syringae]MCF5458268.1 secretion protein [Pseudomonas syringae]
MAYFVIRFIGQEGSILTKPIEALTREEAISKSGFRASNIQSVEIDHLGALKASLTEKRLPISEQILALVTIASKLETGRTPGKAVAEAVDLARLGLSQPDLANCDTPADYFKLMRFDETAILLADAGAKAGNLADALKRAAAVMRDRMRTKKEFAKPMRAAAINFTVGVASGIGFPIFGGGMMYEFIYKQKFPITPTVLSKTLMGLNHFYTTYWPVVLIMLITTLLFRNKVWETVRSWPFFNLFDNRIRCQRGLAFIQTYQLLTASGYTNPQVLKFMLDRSKGRSRDLYEDALQRIKEGRELGNIFDNEEWPKIISQNMKGFEQQNLDGRARILTNLTEALTEMFVNYSEKIATRMSLGSMLVLISSILLFALGFYVPLMTMRMTM